MRAYVRRPIGEGHNNGNIGPVFFAINEDRMSGSSKICRNEPQNSPPGNSSNEIKNGDGCIPPENQVAGGQVFPGGPQSPLGDSTSEDTSSQKMYWNSINSNTVNDFDSSINPHGGVIKAESWTTPTSGSSTVGSSSVNPASNGPPALRPYMSSAAGTPNSGSHHATYTPCSSNSSGMYEGTTLPLPKREIVSLTSSSSSNDNGGPYIVPTSGTEYAYPQPNTSDSSIDSQSVPMWSGHQAAPSSRSQAADYYSSSSQNSMKGGVGGSVRFDNRLDATGYPLPQESLPPVEENKEELIEEIIELEGYPDSGGDEDEEYFNFGSNIRVPTVSDSFEGIDFEQLFTASKSHSEKIIDLARQFYYKFGELLEEGGRGEQQGNGYSGFILENMDSVLRILTSMLEDCLFHMVDWVNRTEIFRIIRVEDKMQLLNSSWSEVIIIELLQCLILNLREETRVGTVTPTEPSNMELYRLVITLMNYLLPSDDNQRMMGLIKRFLDLRLSSYEFTCLKFLVIFNYLKHDVNLTQPSLRYVQQVHGELCHFLIRAARRTFRRGGRIPNLSDYLSFSNQNTSPVMLATLAASERLSLLLSRLTEVKHVAFQMENFLVGRYYACLIPDESLLNEMLLTKRGARNRVPSVPQQPPAPPAPLGGFQYNYSTPPPTQTLPMKRDPNVYTSSVATSDWRPQSPGGGGGDGYQAGTPAQYYPCTTPHPVAAAPSSADFCSSQAPTQPPDQTQNPGFFMPPQNVVTSQSTTQQQHHQQQQQ